MISSLQFIYPLQFPASSFPLTRSSPLALHFLLLPLHPPPSPLILFVPFLRGYDFGLIALLNSGSLYFLSPGVAHPYLVSLLSHHPKPRHCRCLTPSPVASHQVPSFFSQKMSLHLRPHSRAQAAWDQYQARAPCQAQTQSLCRSSGAM